MIDTLQINLPVFDISKINKLIIQPSPFEASTNQQLNNRHLFIDREGEIYTGSKAYYNDEFLQLSIKPKFDLEKREGKTIKVFEDKYDKYFSDMYKYKFKTQDRTGENYLSFHTSLPKVFSIMKNNQAINLKCLNSDQEKETLIFLYKHLKDHVGIAGDFDQGLITRLDTFTNIKTDLKFSSYATIFKLINLSRKEKFEYKGETFLFRNNSSQICIYDKLNELINKNIKYNNSLIRIENRYTTKKKVFNRFSTSNISDLFNNYDMVKADYEETITKNIFKYNSKQFEQLGINFTDQVFQYFSNSGSRYWVNEMFYFWARQSIRKYISIESFFEVAKNYVKKSRYYELRSKFEKNKIIERKFFNIADKNILDLYEEIKGKFYEGLKKVA